MSIADEYKTIYQREIESTSNELICTYSSTVDTHIFQPLSHNCLKACPSGCSSDCHIKLGELLRKNLVFYCYGEEEIVQKFNDGNFTNLEDAILFAYKNRLPKRNAKQDGLPGEVLLDLIIQTHEPGAYKLAVRTMFRQDDNSEIKGFDLTYFTFQNNHISLWLGQAKMGEKGYCKQGIHSDLLKLNSEYLSRQIYLIAEKQAGITEEGKAITNAINHINMLTIRESDEKRAESLIKFFSDKHIDIKIPCLLSYGEGSVYTDIPSINQAINREIEQVQKYFKTKQYPFNGIVPKILFYVFPLKDLDRLRGQGGFYNELC